MNQAQKSAIAHLTEIEDQAIVDHICRYPVSGNKSMTKNWDAYKKILLKAFGIWNSRFFKHLVYKLFVQYSIMMYKKNLKIVWQINSLLINVCRCWHVVGVIMCMITGKVAFFFCRTEINETILHICPVNFDLFNIHSCELIFLYTTSKLRDLC